MALANDTEIEPANGPPFGLIAGVLTVVFFEVVAVVVALAVDTLVAVDTVLVVDMLVVGVVDVVVLVSAFDGGD